MKSRLRINGIEQEKIMKQMIILVAMVILGIAISAMILGFRDTAQSLTDTTKEKMVTELGIG